MGVITGMKKGGPLMKSLTAFPSVGYQPLFVNADGEVVLSSSLPTINPNDGSWWLNGNTLQKSIAIGIEDSVSGTKAWRADEPSTLTLDGTDVAVWTDYLASATITTAGGSRSTFYESGGPNDGPYIKKPSGKLLAVDTLPFTTTPFTLYAVVRTPSIVTGVPLLFMGTNNGSTGLQYDSANSGYVYAYTSTSVTYRSIPRTEWMLIAIRFQDTDTLSAEINDEPPPALVENAGAGSSAYTISALSFIYTNIEVAELRIIPEYVNDSLNLQIKQAIIDRYSLTGPAKKAILFGDSHAGGLQSGTVTGNPYYLNAMTGTGVRLSMAATASTCFNNNNSSYDFQDIVDNYTAAKWAGYKKIISYGTNDCQTASGGYGWTSWASWKAAVKANIQKFITSGTDPADICLITPPYCSNPVVIGNLPTVQTLINEIASELATSSIDWTDLMQDASLDAYTHTGSDGLHANDAMHALLTTPLATFINA